MIDAEHSTQNSKSKYEFFLGPEASNKRQEMRKLMAAILLSTLVKPDSYLFIQNAHKPEETQFTNRERWQDIFSGLKSSRHESDLYFSDLEDDFTSPEAKTQPPKMPFEIYPHSAAPTESDFASANRANQIMREQLTAQGWEGGDINEEQFNKAKSGALRQLHPDINMSLSETDAEAAKLISGQSSEIKKELFTQEHDSSAPAA